MADHDLSTDLDLAYKQAFTPALMAAKNLLAAVRCHDLTRPTWAGIEALQVTEAHCVDALGMLISNTPCRWCGRPHGDPQCRCKRRTPESDEDVRLAEPVE